SGSAKIWLVKSVDVERRRPRSRIALNRKKRLVRAMVPWGLREEHTTAISCATWAQVFHQHPGAWGRSVIAPERCFLHLKTNPYAELDIPGRIGRDRLAEVRVS